jgi:hypothetical protein
MPESSFTFPPPSVPARPSTSSVSPVAISADAIVAESGTWHRPSGKAMVAAVALTVLGTVLVLGVFSGISARASAVLGSAWSGAVSPAALTVLGAAANDLMASSVLSPEDQDDSLPAVAGPDNTVAVDPTRQAPWEVKAAGRAALTAVLSQAAKTCSRPGMAPVTGRVDVVFSSLGVVDDAVAQGPIGQSEVGECLVREARRARITQFEGADFHAAKVITVR